MPPSRERGPFPSGDNEGGGPRKRAATLVVRPAEQGAATPSRHPAAQRAGGASRRPLSALVNPRNQPIRNLRRVFPIGSVFGQMLFFEIHPPYQER